MQHTFEALLLLDSRQDRIPHDFDYLVSLAWLTGGNRHSRVHHFPPYCLVFCVIIIVPINVNVNKIIASEDIPAPFNLTSTAKVNMFGYALCLYRYNTAFKHPADAFSQTGNNLRPQVGNDGAASALHSIQTRA
jgi:hypothetical protein